MTVLSISTSSAFSIVQPQLAHHLTPLFHVYSIHIAVVPDTILIKPIISTSSALLHVLILYERHSPKNEFLIHFILHGYKGICGVVNQLDLVEVECLINLALSEIEFFLLALQLTYPI